MRQIFWNIEYGAILYPLTAIAVGLFVYSLYRHYRRWRLGRPDDRNRQLGKRIRAFVVTTVVDGILHRRFLGIGGRPGELYAGLSHFLIFAGAVLLLLGTAALGISHYIYDFLRGGFYLGHALATDVGGIFVLVGTGLVLVRRYILKPPRLRNSPNDLSLLLYILIVTVTGFLLEGFRIAATELKTDLALWSPGGYALALAFSSLNQATLLRWHAIWWWVHIIITTGGAAYLAVYSQRVRHLVVTPLNVFYRSLAPKSTPTPVSLETSDPLGAGKVRDFTWKQLLDLDACTECGRCQDHCPAHLSGKPLSPMTMMQKLRANLHGQNHSSAPLKEAISEDELLSCTTCYACQQSCPVYVEHIPKIIDMRRYLVDRGQVSDVTSKSLESTLSLGNPWQLPPGVRSDWAANLPVKRVQEKGTADVLYWVGCTSAYTPEAQGIAVATARLLTEAGVNFVILGNEERCCGDPARRLGEEGLFQRLSRENVRTLQELGIKRIVTHCPHCFNVLKNEYPQFGGHFEVTHHSVLLLDLLKRGKIALTRSLQQTVTFHDPCYLGRYNSVYDAPRQALKLVSGTKLVEMPFSRANSFCCGGSGQMWVDAGGGERINYLRLSHAEKAGAQMVVTACPFCKIMLEEAATYRRPDYKTEVRDIAELLYEAK